MVAGVSLDHTRAWGGRPVGEKAGCVVGWDAGVAWATKMVPPSPWVLGLTMRAGCSSFRKRSSATRNWKACRAAALVVGLVVLRVVGGTVAGWRVRPARPVGS